MKMATRVENPHSTRTLSRETDRSLTVENIDEGTVT